MDVNETKLKERVPKTIITLPTLGKFKKREVHYSKYVTCKQSLTLNDERQEVSRVEQC